MAESPRSGRDYACQEVVELATEYLEGAMTPEQLVAFEVHLNFCDGCFAFLEQVRATATLAGTVAEDDVPDEVMTTLLSVFDERTHE
jgi:predicted anti-sigma-YlaC factor YlaD